MPLAVRGALILEVKVLRPVSVIKDPDVFVSKFKVPDPLMIPLKVRLLVFKPTPTVTVFVRVMLFEIVAAVLDPMLMLLRVTFPVPKAELLPTYTEPPLMVVPPE